MSAVGSLRTLPLPLLRPVAPRRRRAPDDQRIMKLAVPNLIVWLLGFYAFFHLWLNILAELLRFGDRLFYKDWWNCTTVVRGRRGAGSWARWCGGGPH